MAGNNEKLGQDFLTVPDHVCVLVGREPTSFVRMPTHTGLGAHGSELTHSPWSQTQMKDRGDVTPWPTSLSLSLSSLAPLFHTFPDATRIRNAWKMEKKEIRAGERDTYEKKYVRFMCSTLV